MSNNIKLNVGAGGIFSKFMFVIQNINRINPNFSSLYIKNIDDRSLTNEENIFDHIFYQNESSDQVEHICEHLGNYSKFLPIEKSPRLPNYKNIVKKLILQKDIEDKVNLLTSSLGVDQNCIGVHIRLCDMNIYHKDDYGLLTFDNFLEEIKKIKRENQKIFVASDNQESIEKLKSLYGDDIIYIEDFIRGESETENTLHLQLNNFRNPEFWKEAFIEMLLLSKCGSLICRTSNFNNASLVYSETIESVIRL